MAKWIFVLATLFFLNNEIFAQKVPLEIKKTSSQLYLEHTVAAKEGLYSIGRIYNVPPKELASFNKISPETGLSISQKILIPLTENNFAQNDANSGAVALVPVYHTVQPHETLFRLSTNYNKVSVDNLKKWNNLTSNSISSGVLLVVGFLKVDKTESSLAPFAKGLEKTQSNETVITNSPTPTLPEKKDETKEVTKTENVETSEIIEEKKPTINFQGGAFKSLYEEQIQKANTVKDYGISGIFKSTSGWQDGKYYCFSNDAPAGVVLKITDNATGKSVYAKVLDAIPEIKQNEGLSIIISNAAAEELGVSESRFNCSLSYAKED